MGMKNATQGVPRNVPNPEKGTKEKKICPGHRSRILPARKRWGRPVQNEMGKKRAQAGGGKGSDGVDGKKKKKPA